MKKIIILMILILSFCNVAYAESTDIIIDGISVEFDDISGHPFVKDYRTMVPLRATMESFGAEVDWDASDSAAVVKKGSTVVRCRIGEKSIWKNNKEIPNDAEAMAVDGRTYLPIRVVLEAFGAEVIWDNAVKVYTGDLDDLIAEIEGSSMPDTNYLVAWEYAMSYMKDGKFELAAQKIKDIASLVMVKGDVESTALLYEKLGECYEKLGEDKNAATCFKREAFYLSKIADKEDARIEAEKRYRDMVKQRQ